MSTKSSLCVLRSHQIKLSFVGYTLLVMKTENARHVHNALNKFVKNFHFMIDHFLDIELSSDGITKELSF